MRPSDPDFEFLATLDILYVEDEPQVREQAVQFLRRRCRSVTEAGDGREGLAAFQARRHDLVVTDVLMPAMDGLEMAQAIRLLDPKVPILVMTAFDRPEYLLRSIEVGIDRYVLKPVQAEKFHKALGPCARLLRAERELAREQERIQFRHEAAMGLLAGGMAHDFNNLIQSIMASVSLAQVACERGQDPLPSIRTAESCFAQAGELSQRLRLIYSAQDADLEVGPLEPLVQAQVQGALEGTGCAAEFRLTAPLPPVRHHRARLGRVFAILAENAAEAMDRGGTLTVTGEPVTLDAQTPLPLPPGDYVHLAFRDAGRGIPEALLPSIFEPYVSTKPRGSARGTGLGLAVGHAILNQHRGALTAESAPGAGATFHIYLPV